MVAILLAAFAALIALLVGAVYSAMVIAHKTDEMVGRMHEDLEPSKVSVRQTRPAGHKSVLGST